MSAILFIFRVVCTSSILGQPDEIVAKKTDDVHRNGERWYKKAVEVVNDPNRVDKPAEV